MNINPFIYGRPLTPPEMVGRKKELETVFSRLLTSQSTAVIAPPKSGKTTLLQAINDTATRNQVAGNHFRNRFQQEISSYIDAHTLHDIRTPAEFWQRALHPLAEILFPQTTTTPGSRLPRIESPPNPALANLAAAYKAAWNNQFDSTALGNLFKALHREKRHFILIVDEFDDFMANETLHTAEFYGSLRSLTSLPSGLTLVIAARQEVGRLNQLTQVINPHGSPYFNIFTELHLGALKSREMAELLALGEGYFTCTDRQFIANVSGQHPYLAQAAASSLWEAHENKLAESKRYQAAANNFYVQTEAHFADVWRSLSDGGRKGITAVALQQFPAFVTGKTFHAENLTRDLPDYIPELEKIAHYGLITQTGNQWQVTQAGFLWWLADELRRNVQDGTSFTNWLQQQTMNGVLTEGEKKWLRRAANASRPILETGAEAIIKAFVGKIVS